MNYLNSISNMNSTPELLIENEAFDADSENEHTMSEDEASAASEEEDASVDEAISEDEAASVEYEDKESDQKRIKLADEFFEPEWHPVIKTLKETASDTQFIVAKDKELSGKKNLALFNSHQQLLDYIYRVPEEERMLYEWIMPNQPAKLVFDIDSEDADVINNPAAQHLMYQNVFLKTVEVLQDLNIDCRKLRFAISDSTRPKKFSVHMVANFYFKSESFSVILSVRFTAI